MLNERTPTKKIKKDVKVKNDKVTNKVKISQFYMAHKCRFGKDCRNIHHEGIRVNKFKTKSLVTMMSEFYNHGAEEDDSEGDSGIDVDGGLSPDVATEETVTLRDLYWSPGSPFNRIIELIF